jgi:hypothetical protein
MKNIVGIAISFILIFILTSGTASAATASKTTVYVENLDDDNQWVKFYLDGRYMTSVIAAQNSTKYVGYYQLSEGPHELKIEWRDPDTCEWQEKTETIDATGENIIATMTVLPNSESKCVKVAPATKSKIYGSLDIFVRNKDDDGLFIMLFVDGERKRERTIGTNTTVKFIRISSLTPGSHDITIKWKEPDTKEWFEKTQGINITEGENSVTMEADELIYTHMLTRPNSTIDIYVENVDDDDLWVDVFVDSGYALKYIINGTRIHIRKFDKLYPGTHSVRMRWIDPDVHGWHWKEFEVYVGPDEEVTKTYNTTKNIYVRKY